MKRDVTITKTISIDINDIIDYCIAILDGDADLNIRGAIEGYIDNCTTFSSEDIDEYDFVGLVDDVINTMINRLRKREEENNNAD